MINEYQKPFSTQGRKNAALICGDCKGCKNNKGKYYKWGCHCKLPKDKECIRW